MGLREPCLCPRLVAETILRALTIIALVGLLELWCLWCLFLLEDFFFFFAILPVLLLNGFKAPSVNANGLRCLCPRFEPFDLAAFFFFFRLPYVGFTSFKGRVSTMLAPYCKIVSGVPAYNLAMLPRPVPDPAEPCLVSVIWVAETATPQFGSAAFA